MILIIVSARRAAKLCASWRMDAIFAHHPPWAEEMVCAEALL
jgi:hypothetical protein